MAPINSTFGGYNLGYLRLAGPPRMPQRIQDDEFDGVDGSQVTYHGRRARRLVFDGVLAGSATASALNTAVETIQSNCPKVHGTLTHYVGQTSTTYEYCRLDDYYRFGSVGKDGDEKFCSRIRAVFTQFYWE